MVVKAEELENFAGASDGAGAAAKAAKRAKQDAVVKQFAAKIPAGLAEATPEKLMATLQGIRKELAPQIDAAGF